jgi:hypothetical protein
MDMILSLVIGLIIVAVVYWAATAVLNVLPLPGPIKPIASVLIMVICVLYVVIQLLLPLAHGIHVP